jgi:hypothetical protein
MEHQSFRIRDAVEPREVRTCQLSAIGDIVRRVQDGLG